MGVWDLEERGWDVRGSSVLDLPEADEDDLTD